MDYFFLWAHRGASGEAPENTIAAFQKAVDLGCDGIELDLQLSRDNVPVVIHDDRLDRTTDGQGLVASYTLGELRSLDAGSWYSAEFAGEKIPSLREVLAWCPEGVRLNLELKSAAVWKSVATQLKDFPNCRILVSSFDHFLLEKIRASDPRVALGFLSDRCFWRRSLARAARCGAESFHPRQNRVPLSLVRACQEKGIKIFVWTVDDPGQAARLRGKGVSGIFTNIPGRMRQKLVRGCLTC